jgi:hypothetical protein
VLEVKAVQWELGCQAKVLLVRQALHTLAVAEEARVQ